VRRERDRKQQGKFADASDVTAERETPADTATSGATAAWRKLAETETETETETESVTKAGVASGAATVDVKAGRQALVSAEADTHVNGGARGDASTSAGDAGGRANAGVSVNANDGASSGAGGGAAEQAAGPRRAAGALESAVLGVLWSASEPLSPGEVREKLARGELADGGSTLSYSTVVTILTRLHEKRALSRQRDGRAYRYAPLADEAGLAARRLSQLLDRAADREAVLSRFVADLSERDEQVLRDLLGGRGDGAGSSGTA
jgi:predicted transcriptional regulator